MAASSHDWSDIEVFDLLQRRKRIAIKIAIDRCGAPHAEEAVEEAVILTTTHAQRGGFIDRAEGEVWTYFRRALSTQCRGLRTRSRRVGGFVLDESRDTIIGVASDPFDLAASDETLRRLQEELDSLDPELRRVVRRRMEGRTLQSIADEDGVRLDRIYKQERRAHAELRRNLGEHLAP